MADELVPKPRCLHGQLWDECLQCPPPGSWADVAREMARLFPDKGVDWDAWKDEMKELESK